MLLNFIDILHYVILLTFIKKIYFKRSNSIILICITPKLHIETIAELGFDFRCGKTYICYERALKHVYMYIT